MKRKILNARQWRIIRSVPPPEPKTVGNEGGRLVPKFVTVTPAGENHGERGDLRTGCP